MDVEDDMGPIGDVNSSIGIEPMLLQRLEFFKEAGHVDDAAATDDIDAIGVDEAAGQNVEIVSDAVCDNGMACIVTALGTAADLRLMGEDIGELALAFVTPLGAEDDGDRHGWQQGAGEDDDGGDGDSDSNSERN